MPTLNPFDAALESLEEPQKPKPDPILDALEQTERNRLQAMRGAQTRAQDSTPDRAAKVLELSVKTGVSSAVVEGNFDTFSKRLADSAIPYEAIQRDSPRTAEWLAKPEHAAVAKDALEELGTLEWLMTMPITALYRGIH
ncbi:MAG: hypothetical protein FJ125_14670, partial [Deltaproteobacteria bacterium]|nr:hypothetical protein [Deltaproteobacteria bacterium]